MRDTLAARRTPPIDAQLRQLREGETLFDSEGAEQTVALIEAKVAPRGGDRTPQLS